MASLQGSFSAISAIRSGFSSSSSSSLAGVSFVRLPECDRRRSGDRRNRLRMPCRAMVQQAVHGGAPATYAKEMERLSAKESLLLAFKDAGGFEALVTGKTTDMQRIDVNERITGLERLNPTPRPTTSPFLEGRWNFEWFGFGSPGLSAAKIIFERFPSTLAKLPKMDLLLKDGYAKVTAHFKLLNSIAPLRLVDYVSNMWKAEVKLHMFGPSLDVVVAFAGCAMEIESKCILSTRVSIEGPLRMKEEYVEGILESPTVVEETIPEQLKSAYSQAVNTVQQLPVVIRDAVASGLRVPLSGTFQRLFMISYLDEEILIIRDAAGIPEVLTRLDPPSSTMAETSPDYES
ncbi:hypothetical protein QUC31_010485 [Theobroma cacao]